MTAAGRPNTAERPARRPMWWACRGCTLRSSGPSGWTCMGRWTRPGGMRGLGNCQLWSPQEQLPVGRHPGCGGLVSNLPRIRGRKTPDGDRD
uniref:Uncharacterized protein n=1 Tax=Myoviridae sp. ctr0w28 TaxID=2826703 RepID=A0A8S5NSI1_9CAUD|nr:MAG TPA: hypothetical protein [Myoviridae sp. ctr0w28]